MSNETALAVVGEQQQFSQRQLAIITSQIAKGASEDELAYFLEVCKSTGLNPLQKQIYAIMRNQREQVGGEWRTTSRMTIQTGIDGYRLIAARTGQLAGIDDPTYDTEDAEQPKRASVTVWRFVAGHRVPFVATARWAEYAATDKDGKPQSLWKKMPYLMLGKCAEALALRKAFPAELSGVYTGEEMEQADSDGPQGYIEATPTAQQTAAPAPRPQPTPAPAPARPASNPLFERWQALQGEEAPMRTAKRYNGRWIQMFGHGAPFSEEERATFTAWLEREEERRATPATATARVIDESTGEVLTAESEAEPILFDLRTLDTGKIGA